VDGTDHGGIRWFELRKVGDDPWTLFQEGTHAPDSDHRWMGGIAMDGSGNIALGYSVSGDATFPSIRYTGRVASDPLGTMTQAEVTLIDGAGSQIFSTRWGDYSSMSVDPADDCTFWYTNEYMPASGNWQTRIGAFSFPSCQASRFTNIATRGLVLTGDNVHIGGFIIGGSDPKTVLIRARGPTLADFGVSGELNDPFMRLFSGQTVIADNDNWETTSTLCQNSGLNCGGAAEITATGLDPCVGNLTGCTREAAILITLDPGPYTAIVSGVGGSTGVGLVDVFEVGTIGTSVLINISTRGVVGTGDNVMIAGLIIGSSTPKTVLVRARGPVLTDFGVPGELANPFLQFFSGQTVIAQNDNWETTDPLCGAPAVSCGGQAEIVATGLDPCVGNLTGCAKESAILITLPSGAYTAIVSGVNGGTGVGLVEVFEVSN